MSTTGLELFSTSTYLPFEEFGTLLNFTPVNNITELSAVGWDDEETFMDELATFFPFPRYYNRGWEGAKECLAELCAKGRLIVIRAVKVSNGAWQNVVKLISEVGGLYSGPRVPEGRVIFVLEGLTDTTVQTAQGALSVKPLEVQQQSYDQSIYSIQVSGKRTHAYYVNLALKVFQRRDWYNHLELSGLGNAIPSIVSIAEILKRYKVAEVEKIETSMVELSDGEGTRSLQKAKMVVLMKKTNSIPEIPDDSEIGDQVI